MQTGEDSNNNPANESNTPIASGGAGSSLDMSNPKDVAAVRNQINRRPKRWGGVTDEVKNAIVEGLAAANQVALNCLQDPDISLSAAKVLANIGSTMATIEGQNQKDEHRADDLDRIDGGKATQAIKLYGQQTPVDDV
jgi:hypothetical protein